MGTQEFLNARFLVPPLLLLFFLFLANPFVFLDFLGNIEGGRGVDLLLGVSVVFALGFLISTFATAFVVNPFRLRDTLSKESRDILSKEPRFSFLDLTQGIDREVVTWLVFNGKDDYIREQLHKRWHVFNASLNSLFALALSIIIVLVFDIQLYHPVFWVASIIISAAALIMTMSSYKSVVRIDNLMVKRILSDTS